VAYTVKLNIEMAMGNLITKVAKDTGTFTLITLQWTCSYRPSTGIDVSEDTTTDKGGVVTNSTRFQNTSMGVQVQVNRQQFTVKDDIG
jgi:hypothetical protein